MEKCEIECQEKDDLVEQKQCTTPFNSSAALNELFYKTPKDISENNVQDAVNESSRASQEFGLPSPFSLANDMRSLSREECYQDVSFLTDDKNKEGFLLNEKNLTGFSETLQRKDATCVPLTTLASSLSQTVEHDIMESSKSKRHSDGFGSGSSLELSHTLTSRTTLGGSDRLLVVANRLPLTVSRSNTNEGDYTFTMSSGGLVSGLRGIKGINFLWIGWPGGDVSEEHRVYVTEQCQSCDCHPVYLDQTIIDLFYNGFCNNILWPLIHYIPPPIEIDANDTYAEQYNAYYRANLSFVEAILQVYDNNDFVWVHDYHLMLVPKLLRARKPNARIGWFLHTPFPSQEVFRMLPYRTELLTGLLSANLIGFHVYDYLRHFINSCVQLLGLENTTQGIDATPVGGVLVYCAVIPIGIDSQQFIQMLKNTNVREAIKKLKAQFAKRKVILGVDRLDYMKGLPHKLNAFDRFLELHPEWKGRCVLVQLAVPSRTVVPEYQRLKSTVHELVGMINGKRGNLTHVPVHYLDQSLSLDELVALYRVADVALISSIRDGMNLVAYEFIACQDGKSGVLILSEFTGAAQSLGAGSIRINPWNLDETANAIHRALTMSKAERFSRHQYALNHVLVHTSQKWAEVFIESLRDASERNEVVRASVPQLLSWDNFLTQFSSSQKRLIIIDLVDGLTPARGNRGMPMKKFKNLIQLPPDVHEALKVLSNEPNCVVIITTTHPPQVLERLFGDTRVCLAAEKGCIYRTRQGKWVRFVEEKSIPNSSETNRSKNMQSVADDTKKSLTSMDLFPSCVGSMPEPPIHAEQTNEIVQINADWCSGVEKVFDFFERRTPGSYTERTTGTVTWYWDDTLPDFGKQQSRELLVHLSAGPLSNTSNADVEVVVGSRFIEVRSPHCSRHKLLQQIIQTEFDCQEPLLCFDFVVCIANFPRRDEDIHWLVESQNVNHFSSLWSETVDNSSIELERQVTLGKVAEASQEMNETIVSEEPSLLKKPVGKKTADFGTKPNKPVVYSIAVGSTISRSKYRLLSPYHVQALVKHMARTYASMKRKEILEQETLALNVSGQSSSTMKTPEEGVWRLRMTPQLGIIDDALSPGTLSPAVYGNGYQISHQPRSLSSFLNGYPLASYRDVTEESQTKSFKQHQQAPILVHDVLKKTQEETTTKKEVTFEKETGSLESPSNKPLKTERSNEATTILPHFPICSSFPLQPDNINQPSISTLSSHRINSKPSYSLETYHEMPQQIKQNTEKHMCKSVEQWNDSVFMNHVTTLIDAPSFVSQSAHPLPSLSSANQRHSKEFNDFDSKYQRLNDFLLGISNNSHHGFHRDPLLEQKDTALKSMSHGRDNGHFYENTYHRSIGVTKETAHRELVESPEEYRFPHKENSTLSEMSHVQESNDRVTVPGPLPSFQLRQSGQYQEKGHLPSEHLSEKVTKLLQAVKKTTNAPPQQCSDGQALLPTGISSKMNDVNQEITKKHIPIVSTLTQSVTLKQQDNENGILKGGEVSHKGTHFKKVKDYKKSQGPNGPEVFSFAGSVGGDWPPFFTNNVTQRHFDPLSSTFNTENRFPGDFSHETLKETTENNAASIVSPTLEAPTYYSPYEKGGLLKSLQHQQAQVRLKLNEPLHGTQEQYKYRERDNKVCKVRHQGKRHYHEDQTNSMTPLHTRTITGTTFHPLNSPTVSTCHTKDMKFSRHYKDHDFTQYGRSGLRTSNHSKKTTDGNKEKTYMEYPQIFSCEEGKPKNNCFVKAFNKSFLTDSDTLKQEQEKPVSYSKTPLLTKKSLPMEKSSHHVQHPLKSLSQTSSKTVLPYSDFLKQPSFLSNYEGFQQPLKPSTTHDKSVMSCMKSFNTSHNVLKYCGNTFSRMSELEIPQLNCSSSYYPVATTSNVSSESNLIPHHALSESLHETSHLPYSETHQKNHKSCVTGSLDPSYPMQNLSCADLKPLDTSTLDPQKMDQVNLDLSTIERDSTLDSKKLEQALFTSSLAHATNQSCLNTTSFKNPPPDQTQHLSYKASATGSLFSHQHKSFDCLSESSFEALPFKKTTDIMNLKRKSVDHSCNDNFSTCDNKTLSALQKNGTTLQSNPLIFPNSSQGTAASDSTNPVKLSQKTLVSGTVHSFHPTSGQQNAFHSHTCAFQPMPHSTESLRHTTNVSCDSTTPKSQTYFNISNNKNVLATFKGPFESPSLSVGGVTLPSHHNYNSTQWCSSLSPQRSVISETKPSCDLANSTLHFLTQSYLPPTSTSHQEGHTTYSTQPSSFTNVDLISSSHSEKIQTYYATDTNLSHSASFTYAPCSTTPLAENTKETVLHSVVDNSIEPISTSHLVPNKEKSEVPL